MSARCMPTTPPVQRRTFSTSFLVSVSAVSTVSVAVTDDAESDAVSAVSAESMAQSVAAEGDTVTQTVAAEGNTVTVAAVGVADDSDAVSVATVASDTVSATNSAAEAHLKVVGLGKVSASVAHGTDGGAVHAGAVRRWGSEATGGDEGHETQKDDCDLGTTGTSQLVRLPGIYLKAG